MSYDSNVRAVVTEEGYEKLKAYSLDNDLKSKLGYSLFEELPETFKTGNGFVYFGWGTFAKKDRETLEDALKYLDFDCNMPYHYTAIGEDIDDCIELVSVTDSNVLPWPALVREFDDEDIELYLGKSLDEKKHTIKFDFGKINQIALADKCKMEELVDNINLGQTTKVTENMIFEWLEAHGLGEKTIIEGWIAPDLDVFVPSEEGKKVGIELENDRHLRLNINAQAFIIANLDKIFEYDTEMQLITNRFFLRDEHTVEWIWFESEEGRDRFAVNVIGKDDVIDLVNACKSVDDFFERLNSNTKQFLYFEDENKELYEEVKERFLMEEPICIGLGKTSIYALTDFFGKDEKEIDSDEKIPSVRQQITDIEQRIAEEHKSEPQTLNKEGSDKDDDLNK